jgi:hypothetical protein
VTEKENAEALRRRRIDRLFDIADQLAALPGPPITEAEIEEEIQSVRSRRSANRACKEDRA